MKLGELEFKPEDSDYPNRDNKWISLEKVNRILREKLAKAPEVFHAHPFGSGFIVPNEPRPIDTHRARLVAIEKIQSQSEDEK